MVRKLTSVILSTLSMFSLVYAVSLTQYIGWLVYVVRNGGGEYNVLSRLGNVWPYHQDSLTVVSIHILSISFGYLIYRITQSDKSVTHFMRYNRNPVILILSSIPILCIAISLDGCFGLYQALNTVLNGYLGIHIFVESWILLYIVCFASVLSSYILHMKDSRLSSTIIKRM